MFLALLWPALVAVGIIKLNGFYYSSNVCNTPIHDVCSFSEDTSFIAKTEEEIDRQCSSLTKHLDCLRDYALACGPENVPFPEHKHGEAGLIVEDLCKKDSPLHQGLVQHAGCVGEVLGNVQPTCFGYAQNKTEVLGQYTWNKAIQSSVGSTYNAELWEPARCVTDSLYDTCVVIETSNKCGSDAQQVVIEILHRKKSLHDVCPQGSEEQINELIGVLHLEDNDEKILRGVIKKE